MDFCPPEHRKSCGLDEGTLMPSAWLREHVARSKPKLSAWCLVHGRMCLPRAAQRHTAGTPCTDYSTWGLQKREDGSTERLFVVWVAQRRFYQEPIVVHENVKRLGVGPLEALLGDLYIVLCLSPFCPTMLGWPGRRPRQICVLVLKSWLIPSAQAVRCINMCFGVRCIKGCFNN